MKLCKSLTVATLKSITETEHIWGLISSMFHFKDQLLCHLKGLFTDSKAWRRWHLKAAVSLCTFLFEEDEGTRCGVGAHLSNMFEAQTAAGDQRRPDGDRATKRATAYCKGGGTWRERKSKQDDSEWSPRWTPAYSCRVPKMEHVGEDQRSCNRVKMYMCKLHVLLLLKIYFESSFPDVWVPCQSDVHTHTSAGRVADAFSTTVSDTLVHQLGTSQEGVGQQITWQQSKVGAGLNCHPLK